MTFKTPCADDKNKQKCEVWIDKLNINEAELSYELFSKNIVPETKLFEKMLFNLDNYNNFDILFNLNNVKQLEITKNKKLPFTNKKFESTSLVDIKDLYVNVEFTKKIKYLRTLIIQKELIFLKYLDNYLKTSKRVMIYLLIERLRKNNIEVKDKFDKYLEELTIKRKQINDTIDLHIKKLYDIMPLYSKYAEN
tara:strand:+ start:775 stop:1356 length:582 start_codon:yes stop_codon:yes gene_type:complete